jgi:hypothetical protein
MLLEVIVEVAAALCVQSGYFLALFCCYGAAFAVLSLVEHEPKDRLISCHRGLMCAHNHTMNPSISHVQAWPCCPSQVWAPSRLGLS